VLKQRALTSKVQVAHSLVPTSSKKSKKKGVKRKGAEVPSLPAPSLPAEASPEPRAAVVTAEVHATVAPPTGLAAQAISGILYLIDSGTGGTIDCLAGWHKTYKRVLGRYKKFLLTHKNLFCVTDTVDDCFIVTRAGDKPPASFPTDRRDWKKGVERAWYKYCKAVPDGTWNLSDFKAAIPTPTETNEVVGSAPPMSPRTEAGSGEFSDVKKKRLIKGKLKRKATDQVQVLSTAPDLAIEAPDLVDQAIEGPNPGPGAFHSS
ncbi:unnamed protein product, partial [Polarella glacialis]